MTGLIGAAEKALRVPKAVFYSMRALLLSLVSCDLLAEGRAEGVTRMDPVALGRLIGMERAPEVETIRRRMEALVGLYSSPTRRRYATSRRRPEVRTMTQARV
ncbi:MAG: hypothetical protein ACYDH5_04315 [Acidimicrobiales bacterium]